MIYLYWWIGIGFVTLVVVLGWHLLKKKKESDSLRDLLDAANPERTKISYRILNNIVAPALGSVLIVIAWPVAIYMKGKELFAERDGGSGDTERDFAVEEKHLLERLSVQEIEQREIVEDPLKAVLALPFGHLHGLDLSMNCRKETRFGSFPQSVQLNGAVKNCERAIP